MDRFWKSAVNLLGASVFETLKEVVRSSWESCVETVLDLTHAHLMISQMWIYGHGIVIHWLWCWISHGEVVWIKFRVNRHGEVVWIKVRVNLRPVCLVDIVARYLPWERQTWGSIPAFGLDLFPWWSYTRDLKIGTIVTTLSDTWRHRVSTGTGWPRVSILWVWWTDWSAASVSVTACADVSEPTCPRGRLHQYMLLGRQIANKHQPEVPEVDCMLLGRQIANRGPRGRLHHYMLLGRQIANRGPRGRLHHYMLLGRQIANRGPRGRLHVAGTSDSQQRSQR